MNTDNLLMTVEQAADFSGFSVRAVRGWRVRGLIEPIRQGGQGRRMLFARGDVVRLVCGVCPVCGSGFKKSSLAQVHCGKPCRQKHSRRRCE